jgi:hypothetical protein
MAENSLRVRGYTLIGETEHGTSHLLLFEKASAE